MAAWWDDVVMENFRHSISSVRPDHWAMGWA